MPITLLSVGQFDSFYFLCPTTHRKLHIVPQHEYSCAVYALAFASSESISAFLKENPK